MAKRRIRISESMLRDMLAKTVKSVISENKRRNAIRRRRLNEAYNNDDEYDVINPDDEERYKGHIWKIWYGYDQPIYLYADDIEDALEIAVAYWEKNGYDDYFVDDYFVDDDRNIYVDSTPHGGGCHYLDSDWLGAKQVK